MTASPVPAGPSDSAGYLTELAGLGEYFALPLAQGPEWHSVAELLAAKALDAHVGRTRAAMAAAAGCPAGAVALRVAASSFQLGVAARLLSPVIGAAVRFGALPVLDRQSLRWRPSGGHTMRFAVADPEWLAATTAPAAAGIIAESVVPVLTDLGARLRDLSSLSARITLGNIASAANGAVTVLAISRPELQTPGRGLVQALLHTAALAGTGSFIEDRFRRRSCCLYYQAPRSGLCGDCVLTAPATSQPGAVG
ncbi:(2Fe-2S)-binding protein [Mycobacterium sp. BMJ-28]